MSLNLLVSGLERARVGGLSSSFALQGLLSAGQAGGRCCGQGYQTWGSSKDETPKSSVDHQWGLEDGVCWERMSLGVLRQDAFLLLSKGETFMVVLMKCRLACEVCGCPLFTISCLKGKASLLPDRVTCCFPGKGWSCSFGDQLGSQSVLG